MGSSTSRRELERASFRPAYGPHPGRLAAGLLAGSVTTRPTSSSREPAVWSDLSVFTTRDAPDV